MSRCAWPMSLDFVLESRLTDQDHHEVHRLTGSFFIVGGVTRELDADNRALLGLRDSYVGGASGVGVFLQLDHLITTGE